MSKGAATVVTSKELQDAINAMVKNIGMAFLKHTETSSSDNNPKKALEETAETLRKRLARVDMEIIAVRDQEHRMQNVPRNRVAKSTLVTRAKVLESRRLHIVNVLVMLSCMSESLAMCMNMSKILAVSLKDCTDAYSVMRDILARSHSDDKSATNLTAGLMEDVVARFQANVNSLIQTHTSLLLK